MKRQHLFYAALGILLVSNLLVLGKVQYNRGDVVQRITLSEREFIPAYHRNKENNATTLRLAWMTPGSTVGNNWYYGRMEADTTLVESFGLPADCSKAREQLREERDAWVLLELAGPTWQKEVDEAVAFLRAELQKPDLEAYQRNGYEDQLRAIPDVQTRLYAIAVAASPQSLVTRAEGNPSRIVVRGVVTNDYECGYLSVHSLLVQNLHVPKELIPASGIPERWQATLAIGRSGEGWIEAITPSVP